MYIEILQLEKFCSEIGIKFKKVKVNNGYELIFRNNVKACQNDKTFCNKDGLIEFDYNDMDIDYKICDISTAKRYLYVKKDEFNNG